MTLLKKLEAHAKAIVQKVSNDPEGRYQLRYKFYQSYGDPLIKTNEGLGNSELAFIKWEIRRGTLNPLDAKKPGSPWWRAVNSDFLFVSTWAQLIHESGETFEELPKPVHFWLDYINNPNAKTWYRAHNSSIIYGYQKADALAYDETIFEQYFINIVLYRLLYAQSMVEGVSFGVLGEIFGNPRGDAVSIITNIASFYPSNYPMTKEDIKYVLHRSHNVIGVIETFFDKVLILEQLDALYREASKWNQAPILNKYTEENKPVYPISLPNRMNFHFTNQLFTTILPDS
jgi:hypothetical protein